MHHPPASGLAFEVAAGTAALLVARVAGEDGLDKEGGTGFAEVQPVEASSAPTQTNRLGRTTV